MNITHLLASLVQSHEGAMDQLRSIRASLVECQSTTNEAFDGLFAQLTTFRAAILQDYDEILASIDHHISALGDPNDTFKDAEDRTPGAAERDVKALNWRGIAEPPSRK